MNRLQTSEDRRPTFEETYPRYEFAPLVTIVLALGDWLAARRDRAKRAPQTPAQTPAASRRAVRAG